MWYRDASRMMRAYKRVFGQMFNLSYVPDFILRAYANIVLPAYMDGELCERFASGREAIRPIIFSHGLSGEKEFYTAIYLAMAAHGYVVVAINH